MCWFNAILMRSLAWDRDECQLGSSVTYDII